MLLFSAGTQAISAMTFKPYLVSFWVISTTVKAEPRCKSKFKAVLKWLTFVSDCKMLFSACGVNG